MEVLEEKGAVVDKFKQEFLGIIDKSENLNLTVFGHEKEMNNLMAEMNSLREQSSATKRVIDESVSSQEAISLQVTSFQQRIRAASIRENSNKNEIGNYEDKKSELETFLEVGSDWQEDQIEERDNLEKERDFKSQKLDSKLSELANLRADIDRMIELIQVDDEEVKVLEGKIETTTEDVRLADEKTKENTREKVAMEKSIFDVRKEIVQGKSYIYYTLTCIHMYTIRDIIFISYIHYVYVKYQN